MEMLDASLRLSPAERGTKRKLSYMGRHVRTFCRVLVRARSALVLSGRPSRAAAGLPVATLTYKRERETGKRVATREQHAVCACAEASLLTTPPDVGWCMSLYRLLTCEGLDTCSTYQSDIHGIAPSDLFCEHAAALGSRW